MIKHTSTKRNLWILRHTFRRNVPPIRRRVTFSAVPASTAIFGTILTGLRRAKPVNMESKEELYHHGLNPYFFETFNNEECIRVLFALETLRTPYTRVPHVDHDVKSLRFYVENQAALDSLKKRIEDGHAVNRHEMTSKYALVYENSFV